MAERITSYQAKFFAHSLTRRLPANDGAKFTATLQDARVDLTPHQIDAALFAFKSPLSKGAILADEVGLGKTIEAGIILSQNWAEHKRKLIVICPANLRMQWCEELQSKFYLPTILLESKSFNAIINEGNFNPFNQEKIVICSYQFAKAKAAYLRQTEWDLVVIDEAHRLRNVYRPTNKISNIIKDALESRKKILMTMILRKLLASSTYAIYGTFCTLIDRLKLILQKNNADFSTDSFSQDYESIDDERDEWIDDDEEFSETCSEPLSPYQLDGIQKEIDELEAFRDLAKRIKKNSKAEHLFQALDKGFEQLAKLGAGRKALIFTESRRTQEFLYELLEERGYKGEVVLFNGSNSDKLSTAIYNKWKEKYAGTDKVTGSATADKRQALVDYFREEATIMIATEAAAEGINLQFCSLIVNYDMPWNPQRIEQRIGRCHRYGQQFDVVVINFLNKANEADIRVYELLDQKFQLFNGIFGTSDEVLGSIGNGVDFEKRIAEIYNSCRTKEEITKAFDNLQSELQTKISDKMIAARSALLENFDTDVADKLRVNLANTISNLSTFERQMWLLVKYTLSTIAIFDENRKMFSIPQNHPFSGLYYLSKNENGKRVSSNDRKGILLRVGHPLTQQIIGDVINNTSLNHEVEIDYTGSADRSAYIEENLIGKSGWMHVEKVSIDSFEAEDHLLISCFTEDCETVPTDIAERLLWLNASEGKDMIKIPSFVISHYNKSINDQRGCIIEESSLRNQTFFDDEMDKLDTWADDMKLSLEREIKDLDAEIKLKKGETKKLTALAEKVAVQRKIKDLEAKRKQKRQNLFEAQDEVDNKKEKLISKVERMLDQKVEQISLFTFRWTIK